MSIDEHWGKNIRTGSTAAVVVVVRRLSCSENQHRLLQNRLEMVEGAMYSLCQADHLRQPFFATLSKCCYQDDSVGVCSATES